LTNDRVDSSFGQQKIEPINEEKATLKSKIERTTIDDVIQIGTSRVKLGKEFDGLVVIDDQVDTVMEDVVPDYGEEKTDKVLIPSICNQDGVLPVLLALKSVHFNFYGLWMCGGRSKRSGEMNCSTKSSP
jgi:hypothetical protein